MASENKNVDNSDMFACSICLEQASEPVVTMCGHLFCWPCLAKWMDSPMSAHNTCPVCKSLISRDSIVPMYGRGADHKTHHPAAAEQAAAEATSAAVNGEYSFNSGEIRQRQNEKENVHPDPTETSESIPPRPQGHRRPPPVNQYGQYVPNGARMGGGGGLGNILPGYGSVNFGFGFGLPFFGFTGVFGRQPPIVQPGVDVNAPAMQQDPENREAQFGKLVSIGIFFFVFILLMLFSSPVTSIHVV